MQYRPPHVSFAHLDSLCRVIVGERIPLTTYQNPQHVLGIAVFLHHLNIFAIILPPNNRSGQSQCDLSTSLAW